MEGKIKLFLVYVAGAVLGVIILWLLGFVKTGSPYYTLNGLLNRATGGGFAPYPSPRPTRRGGGGGVPIVERASLTSGQSMIAPGSLGSVEPMGEMFSKPIGSRSFMT